MQKNQITKVEYDRLIEFCQRSRKALNEIESASTAGLWGDADKLRRELNEWFDKENWND